MWVCDYIVWMILIVILCIVIVCIKVWIKDKFKGDEREKYVWDMKKYKINM